jgi:hypothetical protein
MFRQRRFTETADSAANSVEASPETPMLRRGAHAAPKVETALAMSSGVLVAIVPTGAFHSDFSPWLASRLVDKIRVRKEEAGNSVG